VAEGFDFLEDLTATYYWKPVNNTDLSLCIVLFDSDTTSYKLKKPSPLPKNAVYHRSLDLVLDAGVCADGTRLELVNRTTVTIAPDAYLNSLAYLEQNETRSDVNFLNRYLNFDIDTNVWFPTDSTVRTEIQATGFVEGIWQQRSTSSGILRYIATPSGTFRKFPGSLDPKDYDARLRPWYRRAKAFPSQLALSTPYVDASGLGVVITLSRTLPPQGELS